MSHYGIGALTAVTILAELGDARRFSSSRHAVLDITVHQSDQRRAPGRLPRQGPPALRWALDEAAQLARRPGSPDHHVTDRLHSRIADRDKAGRPRASHPPLDRAHAPPSRRRLHQQQQLALDAGPDTDKEQ